MARILDDLAQRRRGWSAAVPLVLLIAVVAFAVPGGAQSTMYDLEAAEFDFSAWNGLPPDSDSVSQGVMGTFLVNGGGNPGLYELTNSWKVLIYNATADTCYFDVDYNGNNVYSGTADISMGIDDFIISPGGNVSLYLAFGTNSGEQIDVYIDCTHSLVFGMDGNDVINGNTTGNGGYGSRDAFFGGDGLDELSGHEGDDILFGDWFDDTAWVGGDNIFGGDGNDWMYGGVGGYSTRDYLYGEAGSDWMFGGSEPDYLYGGTGRDHMEGGGDHDYLEGQMGCDNLWGDESAVHPMPGGTDGNDYLYGDDPLNSDYGDDFLYGAGGVDYLYGGAGRDVLDGGAGADFLYGDDDADFLHDVDGTSGDSLNGGDGNDRIFSKDGTGHAGDAANGGTGTDWFHLETNDTVTFGAGESNDPNNPTGYSGGTPFENYVFGTFWQINTANERNCP